MAPRTLSDGRPNPHYSLRAAARRCRGVQVMLTPEARAIVEAWPGGTRSARISALIVATEKSTSM